MRTGKIALLHLPFLALLIIAAIVTPSVGGEGDTIMHYYIAEQALRDPIFFFHLWGKPFFTLFASPFTLMGFTGIKIFNVLCGVGAVFLTTLTAKQLKKKYYWSIPIIALLAPAYPSYMFSGLTEPFSALLVSAIVLLFVSKKPLPAYVLASFLPYARSEAKVLILVLLIFAIIQKHYRYIPLLFTGSVLYAIIGSFWHDSIFWIFDSPYKSGESVYGSGTWNHYINRLFEMTGLPTFALLVLGLLYSIKSFLTNSTYRKGEFWLITAGFVALFSAHTTVWALGIFASAGLERVLVLVFPLMWIVMLDGLHMLSMPLKKFPRWQLTVVLVWLGFITTTMIVGNRQVKRFTDTALKLKNEQLLIKEEIAPYIEDYFPEHTHMVANEVYLGIAMEFNMVDSRYCTSWYPNIAENSEKFDSQTLFLWDSYMVPVQYGLTEDKVNTIPWLKEVKRWNTYNGEPLKGNRNYVLYTIAENAVLHE